MLSLLPRDTPALYCRDLLHPLGDVVIGMEYRGVPIDRDRCDQVKTDFERRAAETLENLNKWCVEVDYVGPEMPPNWDSTQQLVLFLHTELGLNLPPSPFCKKGAVRLEEGKVSTDDRALEWLSAANPQCRPGINLLRRLRKETRMARYCSSWLELAIPHADGTWRLHPSYGLSNDNDDRAGAITGRFAVKNPPLQQVPSRGEYGKILRAIFCAPKGQRLICADFSQLEVVILAHLCYRLFGATGLRDKLEPGKPDLHSLTARFVFGEVLGDEYIKKLQLHAFKGDEADKRGKKARDDIKAIRYGLNYGKGSMGFGTTLFTIEGDPLGEERSQALIDGLLAFDPEIAEYQRWVRDFIEEHEGIVSLLGRWCPLPDANAWKRGLRNRAYRRALNYPMQAGGQEVTAAAMIEIANDPELKSYGYQMSLQVHDELCGLVPEEHADAATKRKSELMCGAIKLDAPLQVTAHHADRWADAK